jgi:hypothetical protein
MSSQLPDPQQKRWQRRIGNEQRPLCCAPERPHAESVWIAVHASRFYLVLDGATIAVITALVMVVTSFRGTSLGTNTTLHPIRHGFHRVRKVVVADVRSRREKA